MEQNNILEIKNIAVDFKGFRAVDEVSLSLKEGELRTIIGPNGAGKSTLIDLITSKTRSKSGKIIFRGKISQTVPQVRSPMCTESAENFRGRMYSGI